MEAIAFCLQASDPAELGSVARGAVALRACRLDAWLRGPDNPQGHSMRCLLQNLEVLLLVYPLTVSFHFPAMQGRDLPDQLVERHTAAAAFGKGAVGHNEHAARVPASLRQETGSRDLGCACCTKSLR